MEMLFPFDCIKDYLETHSLILISRANPERIHRCISEILSKEFSKKTGSDDRIKNARNEKPEKLDNTLRFWCKICQKNEYEINAQESALVCTDCGYTEQFINPDNCMYYAESTCQNQQRHDGAKWELRDEILHWSRNPAFGMSLSEDGERLAIARAMTVTNASATDRAISALLYPVMQSIDFIEIEKRVRNGLPLDVFFPVVQKKIFECVRCGEKVLHRYEVRRHGCQWGQKRKRVGW